MASSSALPLKQLFAKFPVRVDTKLANNINRWRLLYETRDQNPEVLNTPLLACAKTAFFPKDQHVLFEMCGINQDDFKRAVRQSSVPKDFIVASDEFNLLITWVAHNVLVSTSISRDLKDKTIVTLFMMLMYKFFTSVVRHSFPYHANRAIMETTIDNLSDKFDIKHKETSTWKLTIQKRAELLVETGSENIHYNTLLTYSPDSKITYILSDLQTRIRTKIRLIASLYYDAVKNGTNIVDTTLTSEDKEGKKTIKEIQKSYDSMISSICNKVLNAQRFISTDYIKIVVALCPNVRPEMIRNVLMQFSALATYQYQKGKGEDMDKTGAFYQGYHIIISNLIQSTYRACILEKVPMRRWDILKKTINLYRSSRVNDPVVLKVKDSIGRFIVATKVSSRDTTNASLKIAIVLYFMLMSFDID